MPRYVLSPQNDVNIPEVFGLPLNPVNCTCNFDWLRPKWMGNTNWGGLNGKALCCSTASDAVDAIFETCIKGTCLINSQVVLQLCYEFCMYVCMYIYSVHIKKLQCVYIK